METLDLISRQICRDSFSVTAKGVRVVNVAELVLLRRKPFLINYSSRLSISSTLFGRYGHSLQKSVRDFGISIWTGASSKVWESSGILDGLHLANRDPR